MNHSALAASLISLPLAAGLDVVEPRRSKTAEGREFTELSFTDPDGHLVVHYQLD